ncbi:MAG: preprotein translocase subunit YajC [Nevskiaceae bacterium]|nr:MAG: preprotein translocase subunit YajC [Nevskiaceae bacterium]TBR73680.1 MAG: preprotein translocase subunit YajC [Nevskiaceae bacterium]
MLDFLIPVAQAADAGSPSAEGGMLSLLFPVALIAIFYFLLIRPQMKRNKEQRQMTQRLAKGDEVVIMGGLAGRVTDIGEVYMTMEIADNVLVKVQKASVNTVLPKGTLKTL